MCGQDFPNLGNVSVGVKLGEDDLGASGCPIAGEVGGEIEHPARAVGGHGAVQANNPAGEPDPDDPRGQDSAPGCGKR